VWAGINLRLDWDAVEIVPPVYIGSGTALGPGCRIVGPTVIGANCVIQGGATVRECIVDDYTRIGAVAELDRKIVYGDHCISPEGQAMELRTHDIGFVLDDARAVLELSESHRLIFELAAEGGTVSKYCHRRLAGL